MNRYRKKMDTKWISITVVGVTLFVVGIVVISLWQGNVNFGDKPVPVIPKTTGTWARTQFATLGNGSVIIDAPNETARFISFRGVDKNGLDANSVLTSAIVGTIFKVHNVAITTEYEYTIRKVLPITYMDGPYVVAGGQNVYNFEVTGLQNMGSATDDLMNFSFDNFITSYTYVGFKSNPVLSDFATAGQMGHVQDQPSSLNGSILAFNTTSDDGKSFYQLFDYINTSDKPVDFVYQYLDNVFTFSVVYSKFYENDRVLLMYGTHTSKNVEYLDIGEVVSSNIFVTV